jgi:hypothetical protein
VGSRGGPHDRDRASAADGQHIRFRSFKTLDLKTRRSSPMLFLLALGLAR